uniref:F-box domain-containing protein n=1 Tax=Rhizophagus irregularis (strain DAOM 181602 / DAOM 197198 / MUCL 43194) TaxID=747089 RepID=U9TX82_RHIID
MACSKIFSGDLPELTEEIIQYFRKDFSTLYSCILVNRLWCRLAIPLLWEDPFSIPTQNYRCIETYLCFLNEDSKAKFNEYIIIDNLLLSNSTLLFNYPNFIKYLDTSKICQSIKYWVDTLVDIYNNDCNDYRLWL